MLFDVCKIYCLMKTCTAAIRFGCHMFSNHAQLFRTVFFVSPSFDHPLLCSLWLSVSYKDWYWKLGNGFESLNIPYYLMMIELQHKKCSSFSNTDKSQYIHTAFFVISCRMFIPHLDVYSSSFFWTTKHSKQKLKRKILYGKNFPWFFEISWYHKITKKMEHKQWNKTKT